MTALGPRDVEPEAWIGWHREAVGLLLRRPAAMLGWLALCLGVHFAAHLAIYDVVRTASLLFLMPLMLMLFVRFAWCADYSRPAGIYDLLPGNHDCGIAIGIGAVMLIMLSAFDVVLAAMAQGFTELVKELGLYREILADGTAAPPPLRYTVMGPILVAGLQLGLLISACLVLLLAFGQWFALPMLVLHQSPLAPSMAMSARAYPMNPVPMMGLAGSLVIGTVLVVLTLGWLGLMLAPYYGAMLYTSYRDVFLGRNASEPARAPAGNGVALETGRS